MELTHKHFEWYEGPDGEEQEAEVLALWRLDDYCPYDGYQSYELVGIEEVVLNGGPPVDLGRNPELVEALHKKVDVGGLDRHEFASLCRRADAQVRDDAADAAWERMREERYA